MTSKTKKVTKAKKPANKGKATLPTAAAIKAAADKFGCRAEGKAVKAVAMYAVKQGATGAEIVDALGGPQMNVLTALADKGFKVSKLVRVCKVTGKETTAYHVA